MLTVQNVSYYIGGRLLLDNVSAQLTGESKTALVGRNGSGKSTLFKLILDRLHADGGRIDVPKGTKIVTVEQEMPAGDITPLEFVIQSDVERTQLLHQLETCTDPNTMGDIYERLIQKDAFGAEARAARILKGLGFSDADQLKEMSAFSGGYRMRVALAVTLFQEPDVLLLDEPTNHLDLETTLWLREFLKKYSKAFLLISHDREFVNDVVTSVWHLNQAQLTSYTGNFDRFIELFEQQQAFSAAFNAKVMAQKQHMMKFVERFKAKASKARQAQSRLKAVEKLSFIPVTEGESITNLDFPEVPNIPSPLISYDKVDLGYGDKVVLKRLGGSIQNDERIALLGANGNGKSTFVKFLSGVLKPLRGDLHTNNKLNIGYYRQDQFETLDPKRTAYASVAECMPTANERQVRTHLGRYGFSNERANQEIVTLSGGEKARLVFCQMAIAMPNMLILDEPTNHLDMEMRESLIQALNVFPGAVILITHDQHLLRHVADRLWIVANQSITPYEGTVDDYYKSLRSSS